MKISKAVLKALSAACWAKERVLDEKSNAGGRPGVGRLHAKKKPRKLRLRRLRTRSRELSELDNVVHEHFLGQTEPADLTPERMLSVIKLEKILQRFELVHHGEKHHEEEVKKVSEGVAKYALGLALRTLRWHLGEVKRFNHAVMVQQRRAKRSRQQLVESSKRHSHRSEYATIRRAIRVFEKAVEARQLAAV